MTSREIEHSLAELACVFFEASEVIRFTQPEEPSPQEIIELAKIVRSAHAAYGRIMS
jgi:hypothetical protein